MKETDFCTKVAFQLKDEEESTLQRIREELSWQRESAYAKGLMWERLWQKSFYRPKRSSANARYIFYKVNQV